MRPLAELLADEPIWPEVRSWIDGATNEVVVLPTDRSRGEDTLERIQVTTRSVLGALALETGGILVDHGWLRILGAGGPRMEGSLATWNGLGPAAAVEPLEDAFLVAYDAVGGFFALDGGAFDAGQGDVFYRAPDNLRWEPLSLPHSGFVHWACMGDVARFAAELRWPGWEAEVEGASADEGFSLYPPPFTKEGRPVERASRRLVPMSELWRFYRDAAQQLGTG